MENNISETPPTAEKQQQYEVYELTKFEPPQIKQGDQVRVTTESGTKYYFKRSETTDSTTSGKKGYLMATRINPQESDQTPYIVVKDPEDTVKHGFQAEVGKPLKYTYIPRPRSTEARKNTSTIVTKIELRKLL